MRATTTILLLILTAGLAWFVLRFDAVSRQVAGVSTRLVDFKNAEADAIEISGKDQKITLQRRGEHWWITSPVEDRANPLLTTILLESLKSFESIETLKQDDLDKEGWKRSGLNGTSTKITLRQGGKNIAICRIGGHTPIENTIYLAISKNNSVDNIHVVQLPKPGVVQNPDVVLPDILGVLQTPASSWRDPALLRLKADSVRRLIFSAGTGIIEFKRAANEPWELVKPLQTRASDERVNAVLAALLHLEAKPIAKGSETTTPGTTALPGMKVSIEAENLEKPVEVALSATADPAGEIQATTSDRPGTFLLSAKAGNIWKLQPNDLRDARLARIPGEELAAIRIKSIANPEIILNKQGETWMLTRFGKTEPANPERVLSLINEMNAALVREFSADVANNLDPYGLQQPFLEVEWRVKEKSTLLKFGQGKDNGVFCQYDHEPFIYRINPLLLGALPTDSLKWAALNILSVSTLTVKRIILTEGATPPVNLLYDAELATWSGELAGKDITAQIDRNKANSLLNRLSNFSAETWVSDRTAGYEALKNPSLTIQILATDPLRPDAAPRPRLLSFAPTTPGRLTTSFYGRLDDNPDIFLISRDTYRELVMPVMKQAQ